MIVEKETKFFLNDYNDAIRDSVVHLSAQSSNTVVTHEVTAKGTKYRKNMFIVICRSDEGLIFGQIKLILIKADSVNFVTQNYQSVNLTDQGLHCLADKPVQEKLSCVAQEELADYYPLPAYEMCGLSVIALHHPVLSVE